MLKAIDSVFVHVGASRFGSLVGSSAIGGASKAVARRNQPYSRSRLYTRIPTVTVPVHPRALQVALFVHRKHANDEAGRDAGLASLLAIIAELAPTAVSMEGAAREEAMAELRAAAAKKVRVRSQPQNTARPPARRPALSLVTQAVCSAFHRITCHQACRTLCCCMTRLC